MINCDGVDTNGDDEVSDEMDPNNNMNPEEELVTVDKEEDPQQALNTSNITPNYNVDANYRNKLYKATVH